MKPEGEKEYSFSSKRSNLLFIVLIIGLTLAYAIDFGEIKQLPSIYMRVNKIYVAAAMATMLLFFCCQSIIVNRLLHAFGYAPTQRQTYRYTLIDYYFSSITPGASGGQPSEIFFMRRDGIPIGVSSLVMLIFNGLYHLGVIIVIAFSSFGYLHQILGKQPLYYGLFMFGMAVQVLLVVAFFFLIFSKHMVFRLAGVVVAIIGHFSEKKARSIEAKIKRVLQEYRTGAKWLRQNVGVVIRLIPVAVIHIFLYYTMTFWISRAFGIHNGTLRELVAYQGVFTMTFESLPLPGGVGLAEAGFLRLFQPIYGPHFLTAAMLLTRGVTYYNFLILGGTVTFYSNRKRRSLKKNSENKR